MLLTKALRGQRQRRRGLVDCSQCEQSHLCVCTCVDCPPSEFISPPQPGFHCIPRPMQPFPEELSTIWIKTILWSRDPSTGPEMVACLKTRPMSGTVVREGGSGPLPIQRAQWDCGSCWLCLLFEVRLGCRCGGITVGANFEFPWVSRPLSSGRQAGLVVKAGTLEPDCRGLNLGTTASQL